MEYLLLLICNTNLRECHCHINTSVVMEDILVMRKQLQSTRKCWRVPKSFILNWWWRYCFNMWIPSWSSSIIYDHMIKIYNDSKTCPREEWREKKVDDRGRSWSSTVTWCVKWPHWGGQTNYEELASIHKELERGDILDLEDDKDVEEISSIFLCIKKKKPFREIFSNIHLIQCASLNDWNNKSDF